MDNRPPSSRAGGQAGTRHVRCATPRVVFMRAASMSHMLMCTVLTIFQGRGRAFACMQYAHVLLLQGGQLCTLSCSSQRLRAHVWRLLSKQQQHGIVQSTLWFTVKTTVKTHSGSSHGMCKDEPHAHRTMASVLAHILALGTRLILDAPYLLAM